MVGNYSAEKLQEIHFNTALFPIFQLNNKQSGRFKAVMLRIPSSNADSKAALSPRLIFITKVFGG
jgi:hypothetical protein